jgi:hypothetical protein
MEKFKETAVSSLKNLPFGAESRENRNGPKNGVTQIALQYIEAGA